AGVLDRDVVLQQRLADRGAGGYGDFASLGAVLGVGKGLERGHGARQRDSTLRPDNARARPGYMRAAATPIVASASAWVAASTCAASLDSRAARSAVICASMAARSAGCSSWPSASSALWVAISMRSASTRASTSARIWMSASAVA